VIVSPKDATFDSIGSALSLYLGLATLGKTVTVVSATPMTVEFSSFVGADKLTDRLKKRNFLISLDYQDGSIEKVSYNIEGNKFNLVIEPRPGFEGFSEKNVTYGHSGAIGDTTILLDVIDAASLGGLFSPDEVTHLTENKTTISVGRHETTFGGIQCVDTTATTNVEVVYDLLTALKVTMNEDIASNILSALYMATESFQRSDVTARTFSVASACVSAHGKRFPLQTPSVPVPHPVPEAIPTQPPTVAVSSEPVYAPSASLEPKFGVRGGSSGQQQTFQPTIQTHSQDAVVAPAASNQSTPTPEDWLKPKIFKSSEPGTHK
jgi:nanoRNase/pAp phosphatase (c-di-AMP/oligoRNAs hydrolase)